MKAVVFAYHNVGVRCLRALIGGGVDVALVVTHRDNPNENIWFASVEQVARDYGIPVITPDDPNTPEVLAQVQAARPDFLFSFYYRHMLKAPLLECPSRGAFNMHGSLLPKYRGRVPINWAIIHGETKTGATLHVMNVKPDNGPLVDQMAVPILPDDNADEVFAKVTVAAEMVLARSLPALLAGKAEFRQQDLSQGGYFGGRKPEDGRIDPQAGAADLHNFVRALTHPFPGAFADIDGGRLVIWKTLRAGGHGQQLQTARLHSENGALWLDAVDGGRLKVLSATLDGAALDPTTTQTLTLA
ncbi:MULTISPECIES: formyltransferase [Chromobacterium]|uniref:formyltransferase n=1 Tax=Chromobacterium TaxID=535 RepID=UPI001889C1F4|nr:MULTISPECIES: formyltransferase [Chromobacterium]QOZ82584.1 formyltransferase [Chromobacterium sp. Rain0013]WON82636.1 formyltransferase [Chromobacterium haemolyticum]